MSERRGSQTKRTAPETTSGSKKDQKAAGNIQEQNEEVRKESGPLMYVGPTVTGFAIQNRVYSQIPKEAKERFKMEPSLRNLFIPVAEYPKANRMLREHTGYIYEAFMKAGEVRNGE